MFFQASIQDASFEVRVGGVEKLVELKRCQVVKSYERTSSWHLNSKQVSPMSMEEGLERINDFSLLAILRDWECPPSERGEVLAH